MWFCEAVHSNVKRKKNQRKKEEELGRFYRAQLSRLLYPSSNDGKQIVKWDS